MVFRRKPSRVDQAHNRRKAVSQGYPGWRQNRPNQQGQRPWIMNRHGGDYGSWRKNPKWKPRQVNRGGQPRSPVVPRRGVAPPVNPRPKPPGIPQPPVNPGPVTPKSDPPEFPTPSPDRFGKGGQMPPITSPGQPRIPGPRRPQLPPWMGGPPWTTQPVPDTLPVEPPIGLPGGGPWQPGPGLPGPAPNPWQPGPPQPNPYKHDWKYGFQKAIFGDKSVDPRTYQNWRRKMPRWMRKAVQAGGADWRSHLNDRGRQQMNDLQMRLKSNFYGRRKPVKPPRPRPPWGRPPRPPWGRRRPPRGWGRRWGHPGRRWNPLPRIRQDADLRPQAWG